MTPPLKLEQMGKTFHLNLKKKWFDMIASGEKKEEYRDNTDYWAKRLLDKHRDGIEFDTITFSNGYSRDRRQMVVEFVGLYFGEGKAEWGADPETEYYIIKLGSIVSKNF